MGHRLQYYSRSRDGQQVWRWPRGYFVAGKIGAYAVEVFVAEIELFELDAG